MDKLTDYLNRHVVVRSKLWLEAKGGPLIGSGRAELLRAIERTGSINKAAKQLGMDYRRAWGLIDSMEKHVNFKLVSRRRGGVGKGTWLTEEARKLLKLYEILERRSRHSTEIEFRDVFRRGHGAAQTLPSGH